MFVNFMNHINNINFMKRSLFLTACLFFFTLFAIAQSSESIKFTDATTLTLIGKAKQTPFPYHRLDTVQYKGLSKGENQQARCSAGLALVFRTNSSRIDLAVRYKYHPVRYNMTQIASAGFDLYIKKDGKWMYANSTVPGENKETFTLISHMDKEDKECLLYLPLYSELESLQVGVDQAAHLVSMPNPFSHKIAVFGSSFTQGICANRPGMTYPAQLSRNMNIHICNLGFSGNAKMQPYFASYLADVKVDAFVFDVFSNPDDKMIRERLIPFIKKIREKQPETPLIFVQTIYRESTNFNLANRDREKKKKAAAEEMMKEAQEKFTNVYFVHGLELTGTDHETSTDGTHPSDMGYYRWANNLGGALKGIFAQHPL